MISKLFSDVKLLHPSLISSSLVAVSNLSSLTDHCSLTTINIASQHSLSSYLSFIVCFSSKYLHLLQYFLSAANITDVRNITRASTTVQVMPLVNFTPELEPVLNMIHYLCTLSLKNMTHYMSIRT